MTNDTEQASSATSMVQLSAAARWIAFRRVLGAFYFCLRVSFGFLVRYVLAFDFMLLHSYPAQARNFRFSSHTHHTTGNSGQGKACGTLLSLDSNGSEIFPVQELISSA